MKLTTSRLILRDFSSEDWQDLYAYLSDPDVVKFEPHDPFNEEQSRQEAKNRAKNKAFIAVCLKDTGKVIGNLYCEEQPFRGYEIGYVFNREYQHQGYATEAASALLNMLFQDTDAHRVFAMCDPLNKPSWQLMKRLHMRKEGHFRSSAFFHTDEKTGEPIWHDCYTFAVLRDEWLKTL